MLGRPLQSPYAPRTFSLLRQRWLWVVIGLWMLWAGFLSEHSLWSILRLRRELKATNADIARAGEQSQELNAQLHDPQARAEHAEALLRQQGMARPGETLYRLGGAATDSLRR